MSTGKRVAALVACALTWGLAPATSMADETVVVGPFEPVFTPAKLTADANLGKLVFSYGPDGSGTLEKHRITDKKFFDSGKRKKGRFAIRPSSGAFPYVCTLHPKMKGSFRIRPVIESSSPQEISLRWAVDDANTGDRFDVRYRENSGPWIPLFTETPKRFGNLDLHLDGTAAPGTRFDFQARSLKDDKRSGWSPAASVTLPGGGPG